MGIDPVSSIHIPYIGEAFIGGNFITHLSCPHSTIHCKLVKIAILVLQQKSAGPESVQGRPCKNIILSYDADAVELKSEYACLLRGLYLIKITIVGITNRINIPCLICNDTGKSILFIVFSTIPYYYTGRGYQFIIRPVRSKIPEIMNQSYLTSYLGMIAVIIRLQCKANSLKPITHRSHRPYIETP